MKDDRKNSYFGKKRTRQAVSTLNKEPLPISIASRQTRWEIPDDVVDEMLAELREQENAAHE